MGALLVLGLGFALLALAGTRGQATPPPSGRGDAPPRGRGRPGPGPRRAPPRGSRRGGFGQKLEEDRAQGCDFYLHRLDHKGQSVASELASPAGRTIAEAIDDGQTMIGLEEDPLDGAPGSWVLLATCPSGNYFVATLRVVQ